MEVRRLHTYNEPAAFSLSAAQLAGKRALNPGSAARLLFSARVVHARPAATVQVLREITAQSRRRAILPRGRQTIEGLIELERRIATRGPRSIFGRVQKARCCACEIRANKAQANREPADERCTRITNTRTKVMSSFYLAARFSRRFEPVYNAEKVIHRQTASKGTGYDALKALGGNGSS